MENSLIKSSDVKMKLRVLGETTADGFPDSSIEHFCREGADLIEAQEKEIAELSAQLVEAKELLQSALEFKGCDALYGLKYDISDFMQKTSSRSLNELSIGIIDGLRQEMLAEQNSLPHELMPNSVAGTNRYLLHKIEILNRDKERD